MCIHLLSIALHQAMKFSTLLAMVSWLLVATSHQGFSQRFKNAAAFKTIAAQDKLIDEALLSIPSNELILFQPKPPSTQTAAREDSFQIVDFFPITNDPNVSLPLRHGYVLSETDPKGSDRINVPDLPETVAAMGDFDGDGQQEMIRAVEDDQGEILLYLFDSIEVGNTLADIKLSGASQLIHRIAAPTNFLPITPGYPTIKLHAAKLAQGDQDNLIITYLRRVNNETYRLNLALWQEGIVATHSWELPFAAFENVGRLAPLYDLCTADFELDGVPEIALSFQELDIFSSSATSFFAFVHHHVSILRFDQQQLTPVYDRRIEQSQTIGIDVIKNGAGSHTSYSNIKAAPIIRAKDLDGDLVPELLSLYAESYNSRSNPSRSTPFVEGEMYLKGDVFQLWDDSLQAGRNFFDTLLPIGNLFLATGLVNRRNTFGSQHDIQFSVDVFLQDVDGDQQAELVCGFWDYHSTGSQTTVGSNAIAVAAYQFSQPDEITFSQTTAVVDFFTHFEEHAVPQKFLNVSDLDGDGTAEIVRLYRTANLGKDQLVVYQYLPPAAGQTNGNLLAVGRKQFPTPTATSHIQLLTADIDGDGIRVGKPKYFQRTGIQQPLAILNAPPIHFDVLDNEVFEINGCYIHEPKETCEFLARYTNETTTSFTATTEFHSDWSVGSSVSGSVSGFVAQVEGKATATYGQSFSKFANNGQTISIGTTVEASIEDRIYASVMVYGMYEYPIFKGDSVIGHILSVTPELQQNRWFSTDSWSAFDYFPRHEVGNIMSYEGFFDQNGRTDLNKDNTIALPIQLLGDGLSVDNSSSYNQTITISDFGTSSRSFGTDFGVSSEASVTVGKKLFGLGAEVTASVSGDYNQSSLNTFSSTVSNTLTLDVSMGSNQSGLESNYVVSPYLYWAKNGAIVLDYTVQPEVEILGGTSTFWSAKYGRNQDPALLLPFRLHPEKGLILQEEIKRFQSRGITYAPRNAQAGDTITLFAAVHNYSLIPTDGQVQVAFYLGNPNCPGAQRLVDIQGRDLAVTEGPSIDARGRALVSFQWVIPEDITTNPRVFVQLDPDDRMTEVHEDNNLGWTILEIAGVAPSQYCNEISVATHNEALAQATLDLTAFPNPFTEHTTFAFSLEQPTKVRLEVRDLAGRQVALLADEPLAPGSYQRQFEAGHLPDGIYIYRLQAGQQQHTGRLVLNH